jgi:hypothetical protein
MDSFAQMISARDNGIPKILIVRINEINGSQ